MSDLSMGASTSATTPALPHRAPSASDAPVFAPIVFHTAEGGVPTTEVPLADWSLADFEVYETFASTARRHPRAFLDAAMDRMTKSVAYWLAERSDLEQVAYDLAAGGAR